MSVIKNIGEYAAASSLTVTHYVKTDEGDGDEIRGTLVVGAHVRFFSAFEAEDHFKRYGFRTSDGIGSFIGERYSSTVLAEVINHPSNPLNFDKGVLPYVPTTEDAQDCQVVRDLWLRVLTVLARLFHGATVSEVPTPPPPAPPPATPPSPPPAPPPPAIQTPVDVRVAELTTAARPLLRVFAKLGASANKAGPINQLSGELEAGFREFARPAVILYRAALAFLAGGAK